MTHRYIAFHKPYDVLCQFSGEGPTLKDYIHVPDIYPVGRLDRDSEGLLILTSDGDLQHRLTDPRFGHERTYLAQVEGIPDDQVIQRLREGFELRDSKGKYHTRPARARRLSAEPLVAPRNPPIRFRKLIPTSWIELTLTEGRNRQVRRMTAHVGCPTLRLIRIASGPLALGQLQPGEWRDLTGREIMALRRATDKPQRLGKFRGNI